MRIGPFGIWELLIILVVVLLIFGPRRLPEMAKGLGQSVREFRKSVRDMKDEFEEGTDPAENEGPKTPKPAAATERPTPPPPAAAAERDDDVARDA